MFMACCDWEAAIEVDNPSPTGGLWELISQPNHTTAVLSALDQNFLDIEGKPARWPRTATLSTTPHADFQEMAKSGGAQ